MNFGSDHRVRNAFRATLLDEPSSASILGTQEVDAADVLEVTDLANAIARAEEALRARSSVAIIDAPATDASDLDIFDSLTATDDAVGPAVHVPYIPTPLPPRADLIPLPPGVTGPATLLREVMTPIPISPPPVGFGAPPTPTPTPNATQQIPPAPQTAPILILDEDAFYHPAGRIRTLAEATLDGYRPEPTVLVRLRERRTTLSWLVLLVLAPLILLALFATAVALGRAEVSTESPAPAPKPGLTVTAPPPPATPTVAAATTAPIAPIATMTATPAVPVFDVNSLKSVPANGKKPRH